jgi:hypothetical protein
MKGNCFGEAIAAASCRIAIIISPAAPCLCAVVASTVGGLAMHVFDFPAPSADKSKIVRQILFAR